MATLELSLPDYLMAFMERQASALGFSTAGEYLCSIIGEVQKRQAKQDLEAKLLEGLQGPKVPMTRAEWDSIEREALAGLAEEPNAS